MQKELAPHESDLLTLLKTCGPHDEVKILVRETKEDGLTWVVMTAKNSKRVLQVRKGKIYLDT